MAVTDPKVVEAAKKAGVSPEEMERALGMLQKAKERAAKIKSGEIKGGKKWSELTKEEKDKFRAKSKRYMAKNRLLIQKAVKAGLTVTEKEIDEALKAPAKR